MNHPDSPNSTSQWPGYQPWHYVFHIYDHAYESKPITLAKLAHEVAKAVRQFKQVSTNPSLSRQLGLTSCNIQDMNGIASTEQGWSVNNVKLESLFLLELRHVSTGSWQPVLIWNARQ